MSAGRRVRPRRLAAVVAALSLSTALTACGGGGGDPTPNPTASEDRRLDELSDAIEAVNTTRGALLALGPLLVGGVQRLEVLDAIAARGDRPGARAAVPPASAALGASRSAADRTAAAVAASRVALDRLDVAAGGSGISDPVARAALAEVSTSGRLEATRTAALARAFGLDEPTYVALRNDVNAWLSRASFFRSDKEAADAYAATTRGRRPTYDGARARLQAADADRVSVGRRTSAAITGARRSLTSLAR